MRIYSLILACCLLLAARLHAEENPLGVSFFGPFLHSQSVPNALFFISEIEPNDSFELRRAMRAHDIKTIVLLSNGGSVWEGLNLAGIIFDNGMTTYVPKFRSNLGCYSACAFMFFAGRTRLVEGELGVHQVGAYNNEMDLQKRALGEVQQTTQFTASEIIGFLNDFGAPPWVFERMFRSRDLYFFTESEKLGLNSGEISHASKQTIDFFLDQLQGEIKNNLVQEKPEDVPPIYTNLHELRIAVQSEMNRLGCSLGPADGVIGRRSRLALEHFLRERKLGITADASLFESQDFLLLLRDIAGPVCLTPPKPPTPSLSGTWDVRVECDTDNYRINLDGLKIRMEGENIYSLHYKSSYPGRDISGSIRVEGILFSGVLNYFNGHSRKFSGAIAGDGDQIKETVRDGCQMKGSRVQ